MLQEFVNKINNQEYISNLLFKNIKENYKQIIPFDFDIDKYNENILEKEYRKYQDYFANMYKEVDNNIHLDKEQIKAILADEDYSLIIAGAGTGKTTTMAAKVKYLVDIKKVDPSSIVVMSFTKKATEELEKRIVIDFGIPANVTTFHSLGMKYIREIFNNRKCYVVGESTQNDIFLDYFKEKIFKDKETIKELIEIFSSKLTSKKWVFGKYFKENYEKYETFEEYFESYKRFRLSEVNDLKKEINEILEKKLNQDTIYTIKGELVKSKGEAIIANFLFCNNIEYQYEQLYEELMPENKAYHPDFTLTLGGQEIYIEYFGLSNYEKQELNRYEKIKKIKEDYHKKRHNKFIKIDYNPNESITKTLKEELIKMGFVLKPKSDKEIFEAILDSNKASQIYPFRDFLYENIKIIKASPKRNNYQTIVNNYLETLKTEEQDIANRQFKYINDFYFYYQDKMFSQIDYGFDFSDMIYYANKYINMVSKNNNLNFKYLIIDEYQDISEERYDFTKNIADNNHAKIVAVGDDWQSIFAFTGSKIEYTYNFEKYFKGAKTFHINKAYRNSQSLIDYTTKFITKNEEQIKKELKSSKEILRPIKFIMFEENNEYEVLKQLILKIHEKKPNHKIMILARKNSMIEECFNGKELKESVGTKIEYVGYEDIKIEGMTIHKSKGLTSDEVILIGLNNSFPSNNNTDFWLKSLFQSKELNEKIPYAEERRVFYVGLTRSKNNVYLLVNKDPNQRSPFINEIYDIIKELEQKN